MQAPPRQGQRRQQNQNRKRGRPPPAKLAAEAAAGAAAGGSPPSLVVDVKARDVEETLAAAPPGSAALVILDPPYGTTRNAWDRQPLSAAKWAAIFEAAWTALRPNGVLLVFGMAPMLSHIIVAHTAHFRYKLYFDKVLPVGHLNAQRMPTRVIEEIAVFYRRPPAYTPQTKPDPRGVRAWSRAGCAARSYGADAGNDYSNGGRKLVPDLISIYAPPRGKVHPTEKPLALAAHLVAMYSAPGDTVVDGFTGSGAVAAAAAAAGRAVYAGDADPAWAEHTRGRVHAALASTPP